MVQKTDLQTNRIYNIKISKKNKEKERKNKMMKRELTMEELESVNGGWSIFDPVKKTIKTVGKWGYDNMIKPVGKWTYDSVINPAGKWINGNVSDFTSEFERY